MYYVKSVKTYYIENTDKINNVETNTQYFDTLKDAAYEFDWMCQIIVDVTDEVTIEVGKVAGKECPIEIYEVNAD